ncbi:ester cyclase [Paludisphaera rhizosphaerae]|uniref:ester cyclase n=1 Tax=Paludisphaera rhizosphaerae TaxID=2711216 RepID=UPI0013ED11D7|nr:ester cyclase [Paludisphaera rhizosphaerae]
MSDNAAIVRRFVDEILNQGDCDGACRFVCEDFVHLAPMPGQEHGLSGFQKTLNEVRAAFPDIYWSVEEQLSDGDRVVSRFVWTGTHEGDFLGLAPTGRRVTVWGMTIDRLVDGKIKETRFLMDVPGLMAQLGVVPAGQP